MEYLRKIWSQEEKLKYQIEEDANNIEIIIIKNIDNIIENKKYNISEYFLQRMKNKWNNNYLCKLNILLTKKLSISEWDIILRKIIK
jgi:hypothetical protein